MGAGASGVLLWGGVGSGRSWAGSSIRPHTRVIDDMVQQANFVQMCRSGDRQCQHIPNGLVEARVGTLAQGDRLVLVLQIVLHVAHLVVHRGQLVHSDPCALLDPGMGRGRRAGRDRNQHGEGTVPGLEELVETNRPLALPHPTLRPFPSIPRHRVDTDYPSKLPRAFGLMAALE